ncbi:flagellar hook-associated protein FlgK [Rhizorhapis sp. SPR117]|uniref:flagellar hook-associated protein FlgK n=1 Tax=Rhizorhapis sp. SPR117 TaxID=2912611 RepID=UPI001F029EEF|nr:flagellar hook-associated protein FlgK [Rhizorhapis sp. SPR117]
MSDLLSIGASGTKAYRAALAAISENISNADTANYARRSIRMSESAVSTSTSAFYVPSANFGGVEVAGVIRASDPYLDASARLTGNRLGSASARAKWLTDVETALNDTKNGVGQLMTSMFASAETLAANPTNESRGTAFLFNIDQVVAAFQQTASDLQTVSEGLASASSVSVSTINDALTELARVNDGLRRVNSGTSVEAQLIDSRDAALSTITSQIDVSIAFGDRGTVTVQYAGNNIVANGAAGTFSVAQNADGTLAMTLDGNAVAAPGNGVLGGLFASASVTSTRITDVDALAVQFAQDMNNWHQAGYTSAGAAGEAILSVGTTAASLQLLISNPADIATASADGTANGNLLNINSIRGTSGAESGWTRIINTHGTLLTATLNEATAAGARDEQARAAREQVSGVDLDLEAAELLRMQQNYSGCAKIIQVARETFKNILDLL